MAKEVTQYPESVNLRWRTGSNPYPEGSPTEEQVSRGSSTNELIKSQGNPNWFNRLDGTSSVGGDFHVVKHNYSEYSTLGKDPLHFSASTNVHQGGNHAFARQFARFHIFDDAVWPSPNLSSVPDLKAAGREAISIMAPTQSAFDGSTFLGELREGLPKVIGFASTGRDRANLAKKAGSEYLNIEFGWKPLLDEAKELSNTIRNAERIWDEYVKNSGRLLRREFQFPVERSTSVTTATRQAMPVLLTANYSNLTGNGKLTTTTTNTKKVWVVAAFKYYVPESGLARFRSKANKLYGANLDPDMLWELSPWSWAIDWVTDAGVLAENISLFQTDSLVMPYCYVMEESSKTVEYEFTGSVYKTYPGQHTHRQTFESVSKRRIVGSPYGFQVDWDGLSPRQWAILAAVGITRT